MSIIDLKKNTVVESGAGCGKTYQLVKAFVKGLKEGHYRIDQVVAITFTIKAAAELKERIILELEAEISDGNEDLRTQLLNIGSSNISTIHAFCIRLLKERPVEAGVDPNFEVLPEEDYNFFHTIYNDWLREHAKDHMQFLDQAVLIRQIDLRRPENPGFIRPANVEELMQAMIEHRELDLYMPEENKDLYTLDELYRQAKALVDKAEGHAQLKLFMSGALVPLRNAATYSSDGLHQALDNISYRPGNRGGAEYASLRREFIELFENGIKRIKYNAVYPQLREFYELTNEAMASFREYYRERLRSEGLIDFAEVLVRTEELLRQSQEARSYFKKRFRFFFVDEFQDTDPLQAQILSYLCEDKKTHAEDWRQVQLAKAKICVVGDAKQSIYRFRRADIETFQFMAERIKTSTSGAEAKLTVNRRSSQRIVKYVNSLFGKLIQRDPINDKSYYQADYEEMTALEGAPEGEQIIFAHPLSDKPANNANEYRDTEARLVALTVKKLIEEKNYQPEDITLLYRVKANMQLTADYLDELGIASMMYGVTSYLDRREVREVSYLLRAIDNPLDHIAVAATLKSMFFNATDVDFLSLVEAGEKLNEGRYYFPDYRYAHTPETGGNLHQAFATLGRWHDEGLKHPPHILLENIFTERAIFAALATTHNGEQKIYNLMKAIVLLNRMQDLPFSQVVTKFREYIETTPEMPELSFEREESQVQLMTIHAAKGLENKVIVIADTVGSASFGNSIFANNLENKLIYRLDNRYEPSDFKRYANQDQKRELAEVERLRYVAATRAKELLVIAYTGYKGKSERFAQAFYEEVGPNEQWQIKIDKLKLDLGNIDLVLFKNSPELAAEQTAINKNIEAKLKKASQPSFDPVSPSEVTELTEEQFRVEVSLGEEDFSYYLEKVDQHILGRIIHKMLELKDAEAAHNAATILIRENKLDIKPEDVISIYEHYRKNPIVEQLKAAKRVYHELPIKYAGENGTLYDGTVDLLYETEEGFILADFKILRNRSEKDKQAIEEKYAPQLAAYARGLEKIGIKVVKSVVVV